MPLPAIVQAGAGLIQSFTGAQRERRAENELEKMIDNYSGGQSIMDFYTKALNKYNSNPYTSSLYSYQKDQIGAGTATGIKELQDRRSAIAGIPGLIQTQNDSLLKAAAAAEGQQGQDLSNLGAATQLKDREDKYKFEAKANLLSQKAGGGASIFNAGLSNAFGGLQSLSDYELAKKYYSTSTSDPNKRTWDIRKVKVPNY